MNMVAETKLGLTLLLNKLGITVVDTSSYPATKHFPERAFDRIVVAGYLPGSACLFTVEVSVNREFPFQMEYTFTIAGEVYDNKFIHEVIMRIPHGGGSGVQFCTFDLEHNTSDVNEGINFFREFLRLVPPDKMQPHFTRYVSLSYTAFYSNKYVELEARYSRHSLEISKWFNKRVLKKMPAGLFISTQMD